MKIRRCLLFISIFASTLFSLNLFAQEYNKWQLPEGARLRIGKGKVHDIKYTPDGKRVAVATSIGIWIYDANTRKELALLTGHTSRVTAIDFRNNPYWTFTFVRLKLTIFFVVMVVKM